MEASRNTNLTLNPEKCIFGESEIKLWGALFTFEELLKMFSDNLFLPYFDLTLPTYILTDGHKTGVGAISCQEKGFIYLKPISIFSQCTNQAEKNYAQLDLEAIAIDFSLHRFRSYLLGLPNETVVITNHFPQINIFNGKLSGSIRTERIELRHHQDIRFYVTCRTVLYSRLS